MKKFILCTVFLFLVPALAEGATLSLTWADNSVSEVGQRIERRKGIEPDTAFKEVHKTSPNVESWQDTTLLDDGNYCYRVVAFNASGDSGPSNISCALPKPNSPGGSLTVKVVTETTITITR